MKFGAAGKSRATLFLHLNQPLEHWNTDEEEKPTSSQRNQLGKPALTLVKAFHAPALHSQLHYITGVPGDVPGHVRVQSQHAFFLGRAIWELKKNNKWNPKFCKYWSPDLSQLLTLKKTLLASSPTPALIGKDTLLVPWPALRSLAANGLRAQGWVWERLPHFILQACEKSAWWAGSTLEGSSSCQAISCHAVPGHQHQREGTTETAIVRIQKYTTESQSVSSERRKCWKPKGCSPGGLLEISFLSSPSEAALIFPHSALQLIAQLL